MSDQAVKSKGTKRREEILQVARAVLINEGFSKFSMREIAARTDMKLGNLQYYFPAREDLLETVIRNEFETNLSALVSIGDTRGNGDTALKAAARFLVQQWMTEGARIYAVMSFLALHEARFQALHQEIYERFYEAIDPFLVRVSPAMRKAERLRKARLITSLMDGALLQSRGAGLGKRAAVPRHFVDDVIETVLLIAKS